MTPEKKGELMKVTGNHRNLPQQEDNEGQRQRDCSALPLTNSTPVHSTGRHTILSTGPQARFPLGLALTATVDPQPLIKIGLRFTLTPSPSLLPSRSLSFSSPVEEKRQSCCEKEQNKITFS